jgi:hypothetical protein
MFKIIFHSFISPGSASLRMLLSPTGPRSEHCVGKSTENRQCSAELFGRPSPRTSLKSSPKISDFENPSDSDSACLFVYAFIL